MVVLELLDSSSITCLGQEQWMCLLVDWEYFYALWVEGLFFQQ